jgi:uncharacterized membrane protein YagU involved in acid resistance
MSMFSPLRRTVVAGVVGTLAMDALWYQRYWRNGGTSSFIGWELGEPAQTFSEAGAPAQFAHEVASRLNIELPASSARLANNTVHWTTGLGWAVAHSVIRTVTPLATLTSGVATGAGAFATSYAVLPRLGIYKQLSEYDGETLWQDLSAHLVFGAAVGIAAGLLRSAQRIDAKRNRA